MAVASRSFDFPSNIVETIDWRLSSRESFKSDQLRPIRIGESRGSWRERNDPENRASSLARLSPRLLRRRESKRHLFVVDSLDKHMQNEKELIRLRRFMPAARTTRARSAQFRLRRELPCTRVVQILPAAQTTRARH